MTGTDQRKSELETLEARIQELEAYVETVQHQMMSVLELLEAQGELLRAQQVSVARVDRIQMEMMTGRVWQMLRRASTLGQKMLGRQKKSGGQPDSIVLHEKSAYLVCDEPLRHDKTPRSGIIGVRGWCVSEGGVDEVELEIKQANLLRRVKPNMARPDVRKAHPDLDENGRAGFLFEVDTMDLANGTYPVVLRLYSEGLPVRETHTSVLIDHENGYASDYDQWIKEFEVADEAMVLLKLPHLRARPKFSIVVPVYNTKAAELRACLDSVLAQSYSLWELCLADDASSKPEIRQILDEYAAADTRIRVTYRTEQGGISAASNTGFEMATGDYITLLDHDDLLAPNALTHVCAALNEHPKADLLYSDEDKVNASGRRYEPFFKPDWSPDLLLSENYVCHLLVLRHELVRRLGGFHPNCDGSQDYDLILRATQHAEQIHHIPKVLYHWRAGETSTAATIDNKHYAIAAAQSAIQGYLDEARTGGTVEPSTIVGRWRVRYPIAAGVRVSIIIASGGKADILRTNVESIMDKTTYREFEIVVVDNSKAGVIKSLVEEMAGRGWPIRYLDQRNKPFNYSALNNYAARSCNSPILLFLNDDTSVITEDWLEAMVELAERPEVGVVGAKLLYPDGRIQHAGVVMGLYDNCGHAFKALDGAGSHYFDFSDVIRNVSAVTGACLMAKRDDFWAVKGFDETEFAVAFNDIDLCLKIGALGRRILYTPHATLYHYEALSKTSKDLIPHPKEVARMRSKWADIIAHDPYYSPNLTRNEEDFSLKRLG